MASGDLLLFLAAVALGTYVQTISGFALGLILVGVATLANLAPIQVTAVVVSLLALANNLVALHRHHDTIDWRLVLATSLTLIPTIGLGLWLLEILAASMQDLMQQILALFIIIGGALLIINPKPRRHAAPHWHAAIAGLLGGLFGGLFSTAGPPLVFHLYRQPLTIRTIRSTLFAIFTIATVARIALTVATDAITVSAIELSLISLPVVVLCTLLGRRFPLPLSDTAFRRLAYLLLVLLGGLLLI